MLSNHDLRYWNKKWQPQFGDNGRYIFVLDPHSGTKTVKIVDTDSDTVALTTNLSNRSWQKGIYRPYDKNSYIFALAGSDTRLSIVDSNPASGDFGDLIQDDINISSSSPVYSVLAAPLSISYDWFYDVFFSLQSGVVFSITKDLFIKTWPVEPINVSQIGGITAVTSYPYSRLHAASQSFFRLEKKGNKFCFKTYPRQPYAQALHSILFQHGLKIGNTQWGSPTSATNAVPRITNLFDLTQQASNTNLATNTSDARITLVYDPVNNMIVRGCKSAANNNFFFISSVTGTPAYDGTDAKLSPGTSETRTNEGLWSPYSGKCYFTGNGASNPTTSGVDKMHVVDCSEALADRVVDTITIGESAPFTLNGEGQMWMNRLMCHEYL